MQTDFESPAPRVTQYGLEEMMGICPMLKKKKSLNRDGFSQGAPNFVKHNRIICDGCLTQPIQGSRFKFIKKGGADLCKKCYDKTENTTPVIEFMKEPNISPETLDKRMNAYYDLLKEIWDEKCKVHFN